MEIMCVNDRCCLEEEDVSKLLDIVSSIEILIKRSSIPGVDSTSILRDIEASRNALLKVRGGIRAMRSRFKNVKKVREVEDCASIVNTVDNMLNRLVEVRNLATRIRDDIAEIDSSTKGTILEKLDELVLGLDRAIFIASLIGLRVVLGLKEVTRDDSGKTASAIGTALFAALLDIYRNELRRTLARCLGIE